MDANCHVEPTQKIIASDERKNLTTVGLAVWGMGCPHCATRVRNGLLALTGVVEADVDHTTGFAFVEYSQDLVSMPDLLQAIAQAGGDNRHRYVGMYLGVVTQQETL
ncbi:MAG: heavy metal-associated domain-containing protein [Chloroflexi bacterium]|nr:heavy metal-associated domain-containing protein [Chloroflexota bacterium]